MTLAKSRVRTLGLEKPIAKWVERRYRPIRSCQAKDSTYNGPEKYWAPNANSTSKLVPRGELERFEQLVLKPSFYLFLRELINRLVD